MKTKKQNVLIRKIVEFLESGSILSEFLKMGLWAGLFFIALNGMKENGSKVYGYFKLVPARYRAHQDESERKRFYQAAIRQARQDLLESEYQKCQESSQSEYQFKKCLAKISNGEW